MKYDVEKVGDDQPHFMEAQESCGGGDVGNTAYWRQFLFCFDKSCVSGSGLTPEEAVKSASKHRADREAFILGEPRKKILNIINKGCRGTREQDDLNNAFSELLFDLDNRLKSNVEKDNLLDQCYEYFLRHHLEAGGLKDKIGELLKKDYPI